MFYNPLSIDNLIVVKPFWGGLVSGLIGAGAGALGSLLGKKKTSSSQYIGTQPYENAANVPGYTDWMDLVTRRSEGANVGLPQEQLTSYSSPIVQGIRQQYADYTKPSMEADLSSRGINYSPLAADLSRRSYMESVDQPINQFLGDINYKNELLKRQEIADAINSRFQGVNFAQGVRQNAANFGMGQAQQRYAIDQGNNIDYMTPIAQGLATAGNVYDVLSPQPDYLSDFLKSGSTQTPTSTIGGATGNTQPTVAPRSSNTGSLYNMYLLKQLLGQK